MAKTFVGNWIVRIPRGHYEERQVGEHGNARTYVAEEPEEREMKIEIDYPELVSLLGKRAGKNKGRKAKLLGGVITATDLGPHRSIR